MEHNKFALLDKLGHSLDILWLAHPTTLQYLFDSMRLKSKQILRSQVHLGSPVTCTAKTLLDVGQITSSF